MTKDPSELLNRFPAEDREIIFAVALLMERIKSLAKEDRDDLLQLFTAWNDAGDADDRRGAWDAMLEVLTRGNVSAKPMTLPAEDHLPRGTEQWAARVGKEIRRLRDGASLTQAQLAHKAGLLQSHISRLENAEYSPTHLTLKKIADALGLPVNAIDPSAD